MLNAKLLLIACALCLSACATTQEVPPTQLPSLKLDPEAMEPIEPNFLCLTENLLFGSPQEQTRLRDALRAGKQPWAIACKPLS